MSNNRNQKPIAGPKQVQLFQILISKEYDISDISYKRMIDNFTTRQIHELLLPEHPSEHAVLVERTYKIRITQFKTYLEKTRLTRYDHLMLFDYSSAAKFIPNYDKTFNEVVASNKFNLLTWTGDQIHYFVCTFKHTLPYLTYKLFNFSKSSFFYDFVKLHWGLDVEKLQELPFNKGNIQLKQYELTPDQILQQVPEIVSQCQKESTEIIKKVAEQNAKQPHVDELLVHTEAVLHNDKQSLKTAEPTSKDINFWTLRQIQSFVKRIDGTQLKQAIEEQFGYRSEKAFYNYLSNKRDVSYYDLLDNTPEAMLEICPNHFDLIQPEINLNQPIKKRKVSDQTAKTNATLPLQVPLSQLFQAYKLPYVPTASGTEVTDKTNNENIENNQQETYDSTQIFLHSIFNAEYHNTDTNSTQVKEIDENGNIDTNDPEVKKILEELNLSYKGTAT